MKHDIENRDDIILLVNTFYSNVKQDKTIGYIFDEVAHVNWDEHLPKMYSFWASLLLGRTFLYRQSHVGTP
jgi:hemoglobin